MSTRVDHRDGYYWAINYDGSYFVVLYEEGLWYMCGEDHPINFLFKPEQIICPIKRPVN
jgi:hypothetical protein